MRKNSNPYSQHNFNNFCAADGPIYLLFDLAQCQRHGNGMEERSSALTVYNCSQKLGSSMPSCSVSDITDRWWTPLNGWLRRRCSLVLGHQRLSFALCWQEHCSGSVELYSGSGPFPVDRPRTPRAGGRTRRPASHRIFATRRQLRSPGFTASRADASMRSTEVYCKPEVEHPGRAI